jgi:hypothetical protein
MFGCTSTSSKPTKEIRERVSKALTEQSVSYIMETPNTYLCKVKDVSMQLEIVKISKFKVRPFLCFAFVYFLGLSAYH